MKIGRLAAAHFSLQGMRAKAPGLKVGSTYFCCHNYASEGVTNSPLRGDVSCFVQEFLNYGGEFPIRKTIPHGT